ncbi:MAG: excinuclease subunit, partial [Patescibacteria group bacterium]|nr:excinuclease subunit [Patescibacteria group bacterium]
PLTGSPKEPEKPPIKEFTQMTQEPAIRQRRFTIYPAKHYVVNESSQKEGLEQIEHDLEVRIKQLKDEGKIVEAYRLQQKVTHDIMMIRELGFVNGIENYSRYFDGRVPGEAPFTLIDYFHENARMFTNGKYLTLIDESHMTLPQIRGMYAGDQARKTTLIEYGFRLPSALDNRPLKSTEFMNRMEQVVHVSATPNDYEISLAEGETVEQLIRPTGLVDPLVTLRPTKYQIEDLVMEVIYRKSLGQRTLVTTLTKRMSEALAEYLNNQEKIIDLIERRKKHTEELEQQDPDERIFLDEGGYLPIDAMEIGPIPVNFLNSTQHNTPIPDLDSFQFPKVAYLHSDIITMERSDILDDLRRGVYDVVVGINLLREGLDLPEVSLVAILDADKEGFLRSRSALIQTMGRAARHEGGQVILYADRMTGSMKAAISETQRRRKIQVDYNTKHGITPTGIKKAIRERMIEKTEEDNSLITKNKKDKKNIPNESELVINLNKGESIDLMKIVVEDLTPLDRKKLAAKLRRRMSQAAKDLDYELAAILRDHIYRLEK